MLGAYKSQSVIQVIQIKSIKKTDLVLLLSNDWLLLPMVQKKYAKPLTKIRL